MPPARCRRHSARARRGAARFPPSPSLFPAAGASLGGRTARRGKGRTHAGGAAMPLDARHRWIVTKVRDQGGELELLRCGVVFFTPFFFCFAGAGARAEVGGRRERAHPRSMPCAPRRVRGGSWRTIGPRAGGARPLAGPRGGVRGAARAATVRARWVPFFFAFDARRKKSGCGADAAPEEPWAPSGARGARCARARGAETDGSGRARALVTRGLRSARARCPPPPPPPHASTLARTLPPLQRSGRGCRPAERLPTRAPAVRSPAQGNSPERSAFALASCERARCRRYVRAPGADAAITTDAHEPVDPRGHGPRGLDGHRDGHQRVAGC